MEFDITIETISESLWDYFTDDLETVNLVALELCTNDYLSIDHD